MDLEFLNKNSSFRIGYGFFETIRYYKGKIVFFDDHIARLNMTLKTFGLPTVDLEELKFEILEKIKLNKLQDARIRVTCSLQDGNLIKVIDAVPYRFTFSNQRKITLSKHINSHGDEYRKIKSTSYFVNYQEYVIAQIRGYDEAIFIDNKNHLLEGTKTNIFLVFYEGRFKKLKILTPSIDCGLLPGIGRKKVIEFCKQKGYPIYEKIISADMLRRAREVFLVNSLNGIITSHYFEKKKYKTLFSSKLGFDFFHSFYSEL